MTKIDKGTYRASRPRGFVQFVRLAARMLVCPVDIYRLVYRERGYVDVPAKNVADIANVLSLAWDHLKYGVTFVCDGRFVKVSEMDKVFREENERSERLRALIGTTK